MGLHIDPERGETVKKSQMYLEGDTGSYEYVRTHMSNIIKHIFNSEDYPKVVEDEEKHKIIKVKTSSGNEAQVEEKREVHVNGRKLTITFYYTTCSIMLKGSSKNFS